MSSEMSTTKENAIWEERNLIEAKMKLENSGESDACGIIISTNESKENVPLIDTIKTKKKISGIYKIINKINGKYYIGSSNDIERRWYNHKLELRKNKRGNLYLQRAWNKYGECNFNFLIIENVSIDKLLMIEQKYLDICKNNRNLSYNIGNDAKSPMLGNHHTKEAVEKIILSNKRRKRTFESKMKLSKIMKGRYVGSKNPMYGKHYTNTEVFSLKNIKTDEIFNGTKSQFIKQFNLNAGNVYGLINKKVKSCKGWILNDPIESSPIPLN